MSMSPSNILSKLEELRKWQEKQQERLLEQHNKRLEQNNFTPTERDFLQNSLGVNASLDQSQNRTVSSLKVSKQPLQKKLTEKCNENTTINNTTKPKQPFLRRGAGLSRFRMHPGEQFKPFTKADRNGRSTYLKKAPMDSKAKISEVSEINKPAITPLRAPDVNVKPRATWHTALQMENRTPTVNEGSDIRNFELTPIKSQNLNRFEIQEQAGPNLNASERELLIFEALEQRAIQNSFCSTNSSIVRLLSSTPHKNTPSKHNCDEMNENDTSVFRQHSVQKIYGNGEQFESVYSHQRTEDENFMQVHYAQYGHQYRQTPVIQEIVDDVLIDDAKTIQENAQKLQGIDNYEKKLQNELLDLIEKAIKFKDFVASDDMGSYTSSSSVTSEDLEQESTLQPKHNFNDDKKWSDDETCESTNSSANTSRTWHHRDNKRDMETMTDNCVGDRLTQVDDRESLKNKFEEIEKELKTIQKENGKISKLKNQLERQRREFEKHKKEIVKQVEDEKVRINFTLEEERKKLAKEKLVFERYVKDLQHKPSRKERDEIAALKTEIAALEETLKLKETKNGMALARLRNHIKSLEKENTSLKAEVEKLNRQNGKLVATQKHSRKPTDTKMLHEINKNLTKLTQEQLGKRLVVADKEESSDEDDLKVSKKSKSEMADLSSNKSKTSLREKSRLMPESDEKENVKNIWQDKETSTSNIDKIEETYDRTFRSNCEITTVLSDINQEENKKNDRTESTLSDGTKQIEYNNGNVKTVSPDGNHILFKYYNGDVKETKLLEGTVRYYYHASKVNHTTNADGTELIEFPDGQTERRLRNSCEVQYPNGIIRRTESTGTEEICYPDGTTVTVNMGGERILQLPNGQKEIHTKEHKRRVYPDGTVKLLYPDGLQETRYANGRVRLKDKHGKLLMDSHDPDMLNV